MSLLSKKSGCCSCGGECSKTESNNAPIKVLGMGCKKCNQLEAAVHDALERLGMDTSIDHVTDPAVIATYGVMSTPALVVDGKVVSYGKVLSVDEAAELIKSARRV